MLTVRLPEKLERDLKNQARTEKTAKSEIVKRAIQENGGKYDDVFVIRDGQKLRFDEVATFEPQEVEA